MHWRNPENHNENEQHQLLLFATFQAVYYQRVWQSVSVTAIVISAAHEYFSLKLICKLTFLNGGMSWRVLGGTVGIFWGYLGVEKRLKGYKVLDFLEG